MDKDTQVIETESDVKNQDKKEKSFSPEEQDRFNSLLNARYAKLQEKAEKEKEEYATKLKTDYEKQLEGLRKEKEEISKTFEGYRTEVLAKEEKQNKRSLFNNYLVSNKAHPDIAPFALDDNSVLDAIKLKDGKIENLEDITNILKGQEKYKKLFGEVKTVGAEPLKTSTVITQPKEAESYMDKALKNGTKFMR